MDSTGVEGHENGPGGRKAHASHDLIPREYLRTIAIWSLIPGYAIAGAVVGYFADKWLGTSPYLTALGLLLALVLAVRDIYRLRDVM